MSPVDNTGVDVACDDLERILEQELAAVLAEAHLGSSCCHSGWLDQQRSLPSQPLLNGPNDAT